MPSSYSVTASARFDGQPEEVFDFLLFFFQQPAEARYRGEGNLPEPGRSNRLKQGGKVATQWRYPCELLIEQFGSPFLIRMKLSVEPMRNGAKVTWHWENISRNFLERVFIVIHRLQMRQAVPQHQATVNRLRQEFETRELSGLAEAFNVYRANFDGYRGR